MKSSTSAPAGASLISSKATALVTGSILDLLISVNSLLVDRVFTLYTSYLLRSHKL
jgi:hypothetical protein